MVDEWALQAARRAFVRDDETVSMDIIMRVRAAIEAYEAARWRPIVEAPRDGSKFLAMWADEPRRIVIMWWWEFGEGWTTEEGANRYPPGHSYCHGLMFRTIDPPRTAQLPQDARQQPMEGKSDVS